jgi:hypothetical protein
MRIDVILLADDDPERAAVRMSLGHYQPVRAFEHPAAPHRGDPAATAQH